MPRISDALSFPSSANERHSPREPIALTGKVRELGAVACPVRVLDVSLGGCRLAGTQLSEKAEVWVSLGAAAPIRARVMWARGGEFGCNFYAPLRRAHLHDIRSGRPLR